MSAHSIYIHLPFCKTKCPYCDFASFADHDRHKYQQYIDALCNEIDFRLANYRPSSNLIKTIFLGGGTPSVHSKEELSQIFDTLQKYFVFAEDIEVTLEANPGTIDRVKLEEFKSIGINRISIGAQTFDEALLQKLGRGHIVQDTFQVIEDIHASNFNSWSFDLIYGLPGQSLESWQATLETAIAFEPPHISSYALSIEEKTPYGAIYKNSYHPDLPVEDSIVQMYSLANEMFGRKDLVRYEISNWAKSGHEAKHNLTYWRAEAYYAFGLSAHGYIANIRYRNTRDLSLYLADFKDPKIQNTQGYNFDLVEDKNLIQLEEHLEEKILLGLRLREGLVLSSEIESKINKNQLSKYVESGYLSLDGSLLSLTDLAQMVSNRVIGDLLS